MPNTNNDNDFRQELLEERDALIKDIEYKVFAIDYLNKRIQSHTSGVNISATSRSFLKLSSDFYPSGVLKADNTTTTTVGTDSATPLNSYIVPLNSISRNMLNTSATSGRDFRHAGNVFRVSAGGIYTTDDAVVTFSITLSVGGVTWHTFSSTAGIVTNAPWNFIWWFTVGTIGASGTANTSMMGAANLSLRNDVNNFSVNTTGNLTIQITNSWTGGSAGDSLTIRQFIVELLN